MEPESTPDFDPTPATQLKRQRAWAERIERMRREVDAASKAARAHRAGVLKATRRAPVNTVEETDEKLAKRREAWRAKEAEMKLREKQAGRRAAWDEKQRMMTIGDEGQTRPL